MHATFHSIRELDGCGFAAVNLGHHVRGNAGAA
jgi:hypothetical protein